VPSSGARQLLTDAKTVVVKTAQTAKKEFETLQEKPAQFNCEHCSTLLAVPAPMPWACASCKTVSQPDAVACSACGLKRPSTAQMVLCGVCQKATAVPGSNFMVKVKAGLFDTQKAIKKLYLDVSGKPYILCPRCQNPLHVDMKKAQENRLKPVPTIAGAGTAAGAPTKDSKEGSVAAVMPEEPGNKIKHDDSHATTTPDISMGFGYPSAIAQGSHLVPCSLLYGSDGATGAGIEVVCSKCQERLLVALDAQASGQPPAAAAGAAAAPAPMIPPAPAPAAAVSVAQQQSLVSSAPAPTSGAM